MLENNKKRKMFSLMLKMQKEMNEIINPKWKEANYDWKTAIIIEASEALDSLKWKWWKFEQEDLDNLKIELIDIWHFILSDYCEKYKDEEIVDYFMTREYIIHEHSEFNEKKIKENLKKIMNEATDKDRKVISIKTYFKLLKYSRISLEELFKLYVGKNILNKFRQEKGYKTGKYIKSWNGIEDNEIMFKILNELFKNDTKIEKIPNILYDKLNYEYNTIKKYA